MADRQAAWRSGGPAVSGLHGGGKPGGASGTEQRPVSPSARPPVRLLIDWPLNTATGWGVFGLNLALQLLRSRRVHPTLLMAPELDAASPIARALLQRSVEDQRHLAAQLERSPGARIDCAFPVLRGLGAGFEPHPVSRQVHAERNVGVVFFEDTAITPEALQRAAGYDRVVAGSGWNAALLRQRGLGNVLLAPQGIDPGVFSPGPGSGLLRQRFVIFSGGKLEYRKGQDLVVAAFRRFVARHPEALLVAAWHNAWPATMAGIERAGHVRGLPAQDPHGRLLLGEWLVANGLPPGSFVAVGPLPNWAMAPLYRDADLGLFPNRAEGGTNLVAMEAMACGVPCVLSANTGHLDLIGADRCYALATQRPVAGHCPLYAGCEGWGESDLDEMLERMEQAYRDRDAARRRGAEAARWMRQEWTWERRMDRLLAGLEEAGLV